MSETIQCYISPLPVQSDYYNEGGGV